MKHVTLALALVLGLAACSADFLPFSMGALEGTETAAPDDWAAVGATEIIQFETNPAEPYSVNLWVVTANDLLYVFAGDSKATWVENIEADPAVRLGANGSIYRLTAGQVNGKDEFAMFEELWKSKYGNYPRNRNVDETYLFRLKRAE